MAYHQFAYYYDDLNSEADYDRLAREIKNHLWAHGIQHGIVADLGCGTGELSLRLADYGYDMIGVDASEDMLTVFRDKLTEQGRGDMLLLHQPLEALDLYGTVRAAVSSFDTLNHLPQKAVRQAIRHVSLFLEPGGLFLFDANTPYKHRAVLADAAFEVEGQGGLHCLWRNHFLPEENATEITIEIWEGEEYLCRETFFEYVYTLDFWQETLEKNGLKILEILDGESFSALSDTSERFWVVAAKEKPE
ncbi:class I SAM-dependent methyltransferase [Ruminococcaceae bacterium OttesenSCG-928-I18]|nr:class I SAM-dependent methyltransferase [Ruminococcaceae bacterium OttesenSCG-928-I18]